MRLKGVDVGPLVQRHRANDRFAAFLPVILCSNGYEHNVLYRSISTLHWVPEGYQ